MRRRTEPTLTPTDADLGRAAYLLRRCRRHCGDSLTAYRKFWESPSAATIEQVLKELDALSYHIELLFSVVSPVAEDESYYRIFAEGVVARQQA